MSRETDGAVAPSLRQTWAARSRTWGVVGAGMVAAAAAALALVSLFGLLDVCRDTVATVGRLPVVRTCRPLALTDLWFIAVLIGVLLWPDLSELSFGGLLTLRRAVEEQARRQDRVELGLLRLEQSTQVHSSQEVNVVVTGRDLERIERTIEGKASAFAAQGRAEPRSTEETEVPLQRGVGLDETASAPTADLARAEAQLLRSWEILNRYRMAASAERFSGRPRLQNVPRLSDYQAHIAREWSDFFAEELTAVQAVRNRVAHPPHGLEVSDIEEANRIAQRLVGILESSLLGSGPTAAHFTAPPS